MRREAREEAVADCRACVYAWCVSAAGRGSLDRITPWTAARYATTAHLSGRRFAGSSTTDALAEGTRAAGRAVVNSIEDLESADRRGGAAATLADVLPDHHWWDDPAENARRNHDYAFVPAAERLPAKARPVFRRLAESFGSDQAAIAGELGVSPGRVCRIKTDLAAALARRGYGPERPVPRRRGRPARRTGRRVRPSAA
jgi:hypothetical protein